MLLKRTCCQALTFGFHLSLSFTSKMLNFKMVAYWLVLSAVWGLTMATTIQLPSTEQPGSLLTDNSTSPSLASNTKSGNGDGDIKITGFRAPFVPRDHANTFIVRSLGGLFQGVSIILFIYVIWCMEAKSRIPTFKLQQLSRRRHYTSMMTDEIPNKAFHFKPSFMSPYDSPNFVYQELGGLPGKFRLRKVGDSTEQTRIWTWYFIVSWHEELFEQLKQFGGNVPSFDINVQIGGNEFQMGDIIWT